MSPQFLIKGISSIKPLIQILFGRLLRILEVSQSPQSPQSPQTEVPYPPTNGGQQRLGMLVAFVRPSVTYISL